jgi:hypothetical protein
VSSFLEELLKDTPANFIATDASATPVCATPELQRVQTLPRRTVYSTAFTPQSLGGSLFPIQISALSEARSSQGLLAPVGGGENE